MAGRVIVTGASGLLGRELTKEFKRIGWQCLGLAYTRACGDLVKVDICNRDDVSKTLAQFKPSVVVHAAAERRPDNVEKNPEGTRNLNVTATRMLAEECAKIGAFLIYISTDYVFDGSSPPYKPISKPSPLNAYGCSKLDGEKEVLQHQDTAVLRVPILYGPVENLAESAVTVILKAVKGGVEAKVSDYERRYPTHTCDVAAFCSQLAVKSETDKPTCRGVWHFSGGECYTKYGMAVVMAQELGLPSSHIVPVREPSAGATRPYDCELDCSKSDQLFQVKRSLFQSSIKNILHPFL